MRDGEKCGIQGNGLGHVVYNEMARRLNGDHMRDAPSRNMGPATERHNMTEKTPAPKGLGPTTKAEPRSEVSGRGKALGVMRDKGYAKKGAM